MYRLSHPRPKLSIKLFTILAITFTALFSSLILASTVGRVRAQSLYINDINVPTSLFSDTASEVIPDNITTNIEIKPGMTNPDQIETSLTVNLPTVRILPDSPLYWVKRFIENIRLLISNTPEQRSQLLLYFGNQRLSESLALFQQEKDHLAKNVFYEYSKVVNNLTNELKYSRHEEQLQNRLENQQDKQYLLSLLIGEQVYRWSR